MIQVYLTQSTLSESIICGFALFFIILPILSNFWQLHNSIQAWIIDVDTRQVVQGWIQNHLRTLYFFCIIFGSAFTAVEICNSNIFQLSMFNMGLNRRQKALFKNQRVFSTVLLEV